MWARVPRSQPNTGDKTSKLSVTELTITPSVVAALKERRFVKERQTEQGQKFNDRMCVKHCGWAGYWHGDGVRRAARNGRSQLFKIVLGPGPMGQIKSRVIRRI